MSVPRTVSTLAGLYIWDPPAEGHADAANLFCRIGMNSISFGTINAVGNAVLSAGRLSEPTMSEAACNGLPVGTPCNPKTIILFGAAAKDAAEYV